MIRERLGKARSSRRCYVTHGKAPPQPRLDGCLPEQRQM